MDRRAFLGSLAGLIAAPLHPQAQRAGTARPGGNVTGLTIGHFELVMEKRLELRKETLPGVSHVAILWGVGNADRTAPLSAAARSLKLQLQHLDVTNADFESAFTTAKKAGAGAVMLVESPRTVVNRARIAELGRKHRLPVMSQFSRLVEAAGTKSFRPSISHPYRSAASHNGKDPTCHNTRRRPTTQ